MSPNTPIHTPECGFRCPISTDMAQQLSEDVGAIRGRMEILFRTIEGNGQPGLRQRVEKLEMTQSLPSQEVGTWKQRIIGAGAVIGIFGAAIMGLMAFHQYLK